MNKPTPLATGQLQGFGTLLEPGYLRRAASGLPEVEIEDATLHGEAWLIGGALVLCTLVALLACVL